MKKEFCTYEQALALKELGFDEPCFGYYNTNTQGQMDHKVIEGFLEWFGDNYQPRNSELHHSKITAPLKQQAFRWFREKHNSHSHISKYKEDNFYHYDIFVDEIDEDGDEYYETYPCNELYNSYEEAEQACLDMLIEICKNKQD